ncbi:hypothetical protein PCANB_001568 [Pneumocystis canis]|nr:hypothetical protein PCK1_001558 [Pneumocystis canis]KAG5439269.1 hypothetical protein PCANB_001568 [Pneumocystis canis]
MTNTFVPYTNQIAGHSGVLSDISGAIICKPCTLAEIEFYLAAQNYPAFQRWMPTYIGNLTLNTTATTSQIPSQYDTLSNYSKNADAIVLENLCHSFVRPSTIDVKLGSRLWDDDAPLEKRERLDWVSKHTTSGCLGFRISAMRLWCVCEGIYKTYSKDWGKSLTSETVSEGFRIFLSPVETVEYKNRVVCEWIDSLSQIQDVLRKTELRLYSSSLLFAYESDMDVLKKKIDKDNEENSDREGGRDNNSTDDSNGDDSSHIENGLSTISICRLIDFAHAHWVAGQGPDENVLHGITSLKTLLMEISNEYHR